MSQSTLRSLWACVALLGLTLAMTDSVDAQQLPVTYRLDWTPVSGQLAIYDMNNAGMVVGNVAGAGFIYDSRGGFLGDPNTLHWLSEFMDIPLGVTFSCCTGINDTGMVVGQLRSGIDSVGYVLDLNTREWRYLPQPPVCDWAYGERVNNDGLVLAYFEQTNGAHRAYLHDLTRDYTEGETPYVVLSNPATGAPLELSNHSINLNNEGQVSGKVAEGHFRWTPGLPMVVINDPNLDSMWEINDFGTLCGYGYTYNRKNVRIFTACVYTNQLSFLSSGQPMSAKDINNTDDLAILQPDYYRMSLRHSDYGMLNVDNLLSPDTPQADRDFWNAARLYPVHLNERDWTGFPQLAGTAVRSTTTGKGKGQVTTTEHRLFVLTPE